MHGKGLAILLSKGSPEGPDESDGEDAGESIADSEEFTAMFDAFTEALGVKPDDPDAARQRLSALFGIWCSHKEEY